ncbi:hypothetical protein [Nocardia yunnanensis]|uniref:hypothetical protein n=1 Tax=Nocardia yunnanensis TaxID=2382165 RepID=UPI001FE91022|nr:hypothetical protein [Nocardia yunnanensis]
MPKFTVRRTVAAGVLGTAALGLLAVPAVASAATPDSIASLVNTGSAGSSGGPDVAGPNAVPATPLRPGQPLPGGVIVQQARPGDPSQTVTVSPAR